MAYFERIELWLENRSQRVRWILVPVGFILASGIIFSALLLAAFTLSLFFPFIGPQKDLSVHPLWFLIFVILPNFFGAYGSSLVGGWVAPKFKFLTICVCAGFYIAGSLIGLLSFASVYKIIDFLECGSIIVGAIAAIIHANTSGCFSPTKK